MKPFIHHLLRQEMAVYFENDNQLEDLFQSLVVTRYYVHEGRQAEAFELITQLLKQIQQGKVQNYHKAFISYHPYLALEELVMEYQRQHPMIHLLRFGEAAGVTREQNYAFFRITEEALKNVLQHANASEVYVTLHIKPTQIKLFIGDNGIGFTLPNFHRSKPETFGLTLIRELGKIIGASVQFKTAPGEGTKVYVSLKGNFRNP